jgi:hypothetical protein
MTQKIKFTNTSGYKDFPKPVPAYTMVPDWYKQTDSYVGGEKKPNGEGGTIATIKRCMPVFDAMTAGYLILLPADVWVTVNEMKAVDPETGEPIDGEPTKKTQSFEWANFGLISFHPIDQAPLHPAKNEYPYAKFNNFWAIKTPRGYSVEIMQPVHRESVFTILPGIVDTDRYTAPINFPMVINDPDFQGLIPKGTPIAQIVPFKRESWHMELGKESDFVDQNNVATELQSKFFDRYKSMFRTIKEYK